MASTVTELLRRRFGGKKGNDYIQDGLIFHLDGISRGGTTGHWIDLIGNVDFVLDNDVTESTNCIVCSSTDYARNATYANNESTANSYTIECVFKNNRGWDTSFNVFKPISGIGMTYNQSSNRINRGIRGSSSSTKQWPAFRVNKVIYNIISLNQSRCIQNGISLTTGNQMYSSMGELCSCGPFDGEMYAVRIYNRLLTEDEMLHNQRVDNERFQLGLTI